MDKSDKTGIAAFIACPNCLDSYVDSDLVVGASPEGALIIWCNRCEQQIANIPNDQIANEMLSVTRECDCCGKKEISH